MKKIIVLLLSVMIILSLSACSPKEPDTPIKVYDFTNKAYVYVNEYKGDYVLTVQVNISDETVVDELTLDIDSSGYTNLIKEYGSISEEKLFEELCPTEYGKDKMTYFGSDTIGYTTIKSDTLLEKMKEVTVKITVSDKDGNKVLENKEINTAFCGLINHYPEQFNLEIKTCYPSYEQYNSEVHLFEEEYSPVYTVNGKKLGSDAQDSGLYLNEFEVGNTYRIVTGNFRNYDMSSFDDGWFYTYNPDNDFVRVNILGKEELLIDTPEDFSRIEKIDDLSFVINNRGFVEFNNELAYCLIRYNGKYIAYRMYMPDHHIDTYEVDIDEKQTGNMYLSLQQLDSNHIVYEVYSNEFVDKVDELLEDTNALFELYKKYGYTGTIENIEYMKDHSPYESIEFKIIKAEFDIDKFASAIFDINTKEVVYENIPTIVGDIDRIFYMK